MRFSKRKDIMLKKMVENKGDYLKEIEKMMDEWEKEFHRIPIERKGEYIDGLYNLIRTNEDLIRLRKVRVALFLRLIILIVIFLFCITYMIWHKCM